MRAERVVLILGAGATLADVATRPRKERPPLDKGFFATTALTENVTTVTKYMADVYGIDVMVPPTDSLEAVMGRVYTDVYNPLLQVRALGAFRSILRAFSLRLAHTTNDMRPTNKRLVYRMLSHYLWEGITPANLTIVTFNQDIQVEKHLLHLTTTKKWAGVADEIFCFPGCYKLTDPPKLSRPPSSVATFRSGHSHPGCLAVLKLHGSLNWFSVHNTSAPSRTAMFNPRRKLYITPRQEIEPSMKFNSSKRQFTQPVVVPPVTHKSSVLHDGLRAVWGVAEERLSECNRIIVFGYSCPPLDFESQNLLRRSYRANKNDPIIEIIDPDPTVVARYAELLSPRRLYYYSSASAFLDVRGSHVL